MLKRERIVFDTDLSHLNNLAPLEPEDKSLERFKWRKYGKLCVLKVHNKIKKQPQKVDVLCECGRIVTLPWRAVYKGEVKVCGHKDCYLTQAAEERKALVTPAILVKTKAKYICPCPDENCVISSVCRICCCECDRPCKQCENSPEKCGAKKRKVE